MGYELNKIIRIAFIHDGNFLACLATNGTIKTYNVKMEKRELMYEAERYHHKLYTQVNPKSYFSFLSFIIPELGDSYQFNYYQLVSPEIYDIVNDDCKEKKEGKDQDKDNDSDGYDHDYENI